MLSRNRTRRLLSQCQFTRSHSDHGPLRLLFFGRDEFSCRTFKELYKARDVWESIDIVTTPDGRIGRGLGQISRSPLSIIGQDLDVPCHVIPKEREGRTAWLPPPPFSSPTFNHVIISASYGRAITSDVLSLFDHRLNVHPSLIPKYRGPSPIQTAIANGDLETGVSVINMEDVSQGFDTGDVHAIEKVNIPEGATYNSLVPLLAQKGGEVLVDVLRNLTKGVITRTPQDHSQATKTRMIRQAAGNVDWNKSAYHIERLHRAYGHQRPLVTSFIPNSQKPDAPKALFLSDLSVASFPLPPSLQHLGDCTYLSEIGRTLVLCGEGTGLLVGTVKREGKRSMPSGEWWKGIKGDVTRLGLA